MKAQRMLTALALLTLSVSSGAKDLGTWGNVFEPAEQDMLLFIQNRLKGMEHSGELDRLREEATERVKKHAVRPAPVEGLSLATDYRAFSVDPTFTVRETIPDKSVVEESRASRVVADLARAEQDMVRQASDSGRGRMPEIEEQTLTRTIQKER